MRWGRACPWHGRFLPHGRSVFSFSYLQSEGLVPYAACALLLVLGILRMWRHRRDNSEELIPRPFRKFNCFTLEISICKPKLLPFQRYAWTFNKFQTYQRYKNKKKENRSYSSRGEGWGFFFVTWPHFFTKDSQFYSFWTLCWPWSRGQKRKFFTRICFLDRVFISRRWGQLLLLYVKCWYPSSIAGPYRVERRTGSILTPTAFALIKPPGSNTKHKRKISNLLCSREEPIFAHPICHDTTSPSHAKAKKKERWNRFIARRKSTVLLTYAGTHNNGKNNDNKQSMHKNKTNATQKTKKKH